MTIEPDPVRTAPQASLPASLLAPAPSGAVAAVDVIICTFRRPHLVRTLESLAGQILPPDLDLRVIVADNDDEPSAKPLVLGRIPHFPHPLTYLHAPGRNISIARNAGLEAARAPWVAFIDDDEVASPGWIAALCKAAQASGADAVFGPVLARYPEGAPDWIVSLDILSTWPVHRAGIMETGYAGNVLMRRTGIPWDGLRFDLARGRTGGEDTAFFLAAHRRGARLAAAPEAIAHEQVPPERLRFGWIARRRFRMGQTYASADLSVSRRARLAATATAKALHCGAAALAFLPSGDRRRRWTLRGLLHMGVVAGCLAIPERQGYGG